MRLLPQDVLDLRARWGCWPLSLRWTESGRGEGRLPRPSSGPRMGLEGRPSVLQLQH